MRRARSDRDVAAAQAHLHQRRTGGEINLDLAGEQRRPAGGTRQVDRFDLNTMLVEQLGVGADPQRQDRPRQRPMADQQGRPLLGKSRPIEQDGQRGSNQCRSSTLGFHGSASVMCR